MCRCVYRPCLCIHILSVCCNWFNVFYGTEIEKVSWTMHFMIEILGICQLQLIMHSSGMPHTYNIIQFTLIYNISAFKL